MICCWRGGGQFGKESVPIQAIFVDLRRILSDKIYDPDSHFSRQLAWFQGPSFSTFFDHLLMTPVLSSSWEIITTLRWSEIGTVE